MQATGGRASGPLCATRARGPRKPRGGPFNQPDFLQALAGPRHPDHREVSEWARGFRPESFDIDRANASIAVVCAFYKERGAGDSNGSERSGVPRPSAIGIETAGRLEEAS